MAIINLAYTGYVNPEGASTILTEQQVWAGLQRKVRRGQDFVPVILGTTVYSETRSDERSHPNVPPGELPESIYMTLYVPFPRLTEAGIRLIGSLG